MISAPKMKSNTGIKRSYYEVVQNLYSSSNIIWELKEMIGVVCSMHCGKGLCTAFVWDTQTQRHNLEHQHLEGWITLQHIFKKQDKVHGLDWYGSGQRHVAGYCKHAETLGLIKCGEFVG